MQVSLNLVDIGWFVIFVISCTAGIYAIIALRSINAATREVADMLRQQRSALERSILNIAATTENTAEITREVKKSVCEAEIAIRTISRNTTDAVARVNETADQVSSYVSLIGEIAKAVVDLFPSAKRN
ncbi:MAG: hypothetical protein ACOWWM_15670 [Desulfobacterales bacterium]